MKAEYDFSKGRRGQAIPTKGKTRITIYLDDAILARFRTESERTGRGYQTLINEALAQYTSEPPVTATQVRRIVREELESHA
jgi:uncharacterized protein (DUF4415 family)